MRVFGLLLLSLAIVACGDAVSSNGGNVSTSNGAAASPTPKTTDDVAVQTVTIDSPDGVKLVGSMFAAAKANSPALLLLHQWQSDRHSYDDFAKQMQARGFAVLSIDGRGFGESTKKADGTTIAAGRTDADVKGMLGDVDTAFIYLAKQTNVDANRIGIVGASYGSSLALLYGAEHPKGAVIALLSPGLNYFGNMPTEPAIKKYGSDCAIFMAAAKDDPESAKAVDTLFATWNQSEEMIRKVVKDKGGHGTALFEVGLADDLETFLKKYLLKN